jgi:excisionase family DNA binding protein
MTEAAAPHDPVADASPDHLRLLDADDVCGLWKVRKSWLYDAVESGAIPVVRLGKQLRFRPADIAAYLHASAASSTGTTCLPGGTHRGVP